MHETAAAPVVPPNAESVKPLYAPVAQPLDRRSHPRPSGVSDGADSAQWTIAWGPVVLLGVLLVCLYHGIAVKLVTDWIELPDFSQGFLIPFFALFLLWDNRNEFHDTPIAPSWAGTILGSPWPVHVAAGQARRRPFLSTHLVCSSDRRHPVDLAGQADAATVLVRAVCASARDSAAYDCPQPDHIPFAVARLTLSSDLLQLVGVPVLRDGNIIQLSAIPLEVAEACSGIRSLMSLFTVAVIYGYFLEKATWRRVVLALSALPIAVTANVARIFGTGLCVQYWDPDKAMGFFHEFSGWLMFLVSLGCLYLVHVAMRVVAGKEGSLA
jgi:exosortase/archaeosortase family protein